MQSQSEDRSHGRRRLLISSSCFNRYLRRYVCQGAIFDRGVPIFDRGVPIFDRGVPIFDRGVPIFDHQGAGCDHQGAIFDRGVVG